jgi:hypothetical protein
MWSSILTPECRSLVKWKTRPILTFTMIYFWRNTIFKRSCLIFKYMYFESVFFHHFLILYSPLCDTSGNARYRVEYGYHPECNPQFHSVKLPTFHWSEFINNVFSRDEFPTSTEVHNTKSVTLLLRVKQNYNKENKTAIRKKKQDNQKQLKMINGLKLSWNKYSCIFSELYN